MQPAHVIWATGLHYSLGTVIDSVSEEIRERQFSMSAYLFHPARLEQCKLTDIAPGRVRPIGRLEDKGSAANFRTWKSLSFPHTCQSNFW